MLLNRVEFALMNNPLRAALQRYVEARQLLRLGGPVPGGVALEIGCGGGVGAEIIVDVFAAAAVHGFDRDRRMIARARSRHAHGGARAHCWVGDTAMVPASDAVYDAVFDFGVLHHVPNWGLGIGEIHRVLKPGGVFYGEEILQPLLRRTRNFLAHPQTDRFDAAGFGQALVAAGFQAVRSRSIGQSIAWFVARRPVA